MKWTISSKLLLLFGIMSLSFVCFTIYLKFDLMKFESSLSSYETMHEKIRNAKDVQLSILNVWQFMTDASLTREKSVLTDKAGSSYEKANNNIEELLRINKDDHDNAAKLRTIHKELKTMWDTGNRMFDAYLTEWEQGNAVMADFDEASDKLIKDIGAYVDDVENIEDLESEGLLKRVQRTEWVLTAVLVAGMVNIGFILYFLRTLTNSITKPLASLVQAANEIAEGNLSVEIKDIHVKNEVGDLARDFNRMTENLRAIIGNVKDNVAQLASAAEEMASSSTQIVGGSGEQNAKSTQVATASQELSSTIIDVARNASEAAEKAREANKVAMNGGEIVDRSIESINGIAHVSRETAEMMQKLGARSNEVGTIIKVIDDIANQTNLLALNAAIEAARAGEQGRGFAVVADEVRKLAEKTTKATKEIGETIKTIQQYTNSAVTSMQNEMQVVENGVGFARNAGTALEEIVSQVEAVSSLITQIATASEEQSTAANQISEDIEIVASISSNSTTSAQHIALSSQNIAILAADLQSTVGKFRVS